MIVLLKEGKFYFKAEDGNLIGGSLVVCPNKQIADTFTEFNSREEALTHFNIKEE